MNLHRFFTYASVALGAMLFSISLQAYAFTQPTASPPNNDAYAPLNTGTTAQAKTGGLLLNTGGATNGLIVQYGNTGLGTASPTQLLTVGSAGSAGNAYYNIGANTIGVNSSLYSYGYICVGNSSGSCGGTGGVVISGTGVKFPDGTTQTSAASNPAGAYLPLAGGTITGNLQVNGTAHFTGVGTDTWFPYVNGWNYLRGPTNLSGILYDEQNNGYQLDLNGTNRMNYINADRMDTTILYDSNNTGYYLDPSYVSYVNAFQVAGGSLLANWPGYPAGIQQTNGAYLYPGFQSGQGSGWNTSYYLAGSTSWGLYSNTSLNAQGLYDVGNRVYSAVNPPPATNTSGLIPKDTWWSSTYHGGDGNIYLGFWGKWLSTDLGERATHRGEGTNFIDYSRYVYNNGAYSGSGWIEPSDLGVRYANSAGSATANVLKTGDTMSGSLRVNGSYNTWAGDFTGTTAYGIAVGAGNGIYSYIGYGGYGLYSNGSAYMGGSISGSGLYDSGYRVYSPVNPPPTTAPVACNWTGWVMPTLTNPDGECALIGYKCDGTKIVKMSLAANQSQCVANNFNGEY